MIDARPPLAIDEAAQKVGSISFPLPDDRMDSAQAEGSSCPFLYPAN